MKAKRGLGLFFTLSLALGAGPAGAVGSSTESFFHLARGPVVDVNLSTGIAVLGPELGWGLNLELATEMEPGFPMTMGLDMGVNQWDLPRGIDPLRTFSKTHERGRIASVHLLPTFVYHFHVPLMHDVSPFLGIAMGPNIYMAQGLDGVGASLRKSYDTSVFFQFLVRPGASFRLTRRLGLNLEPKFGWIASRFVFLPQVGAALTL